MIRINSFTHTYIFYSKYVILLIDIEHWYLSMNVMQLDLSVLVVVELKSYSVMSICVCEMKHSIGIDGRIDIINSTLGKALGGAMGGYTTATQSIIDLLRQRARPYLFSNSLAPSIVGSTLQVCY